MILILQLRGISKISFKNISHSIFTYTKCEYTESLGKNDKKFFTVLTQLKKMESSYTNKRSK